MAWEAAYAAADLVGGLVDAGAPRSFAPGLVVPVGAAAYGLRKRQQLFSNDDDDTGTTLERPSKKGRPSRPNLVEVSRADGNQKMGLLTYQRQTAGRRGRSRRRVRRLARLQRRSAYKGSSSNLIANTFPIVFPATDGTTVREGMCAYAYYTPSLAQITEQVANFYAQLEGGASKQTGSFSISVPKQRFEFTWTPDWPTHTSVAVAAKLTLYKFTLKKKTPINDIISTPGGAAPAGNLADMCYYAASNYVGTIPSLGINGLPYDHMAGIVSRFNSNTQVAPTFTATDWNDTKKSPLSVFESPAMMSKLNLAWSRDFYIPNGQSMSFSCGHGPSNIHYPDLEIVRPERTVAKTAPTNGDNFLTPFLPAGWPVFIIGMQRHTASATQSLTNFVFADAINVSHRVYYRVPGFPGRTLQFFNPNSTAYGSSTTVPRYSNVIGTANGTGKADAYTGLNL